MKQARYIITETDPKLLPLSLAEVTFVGRSNVGKSSLICALCENKKLARVSKTPGRTRGINVFEVRHDRWLVDLPGFGFSVAPQKQREYWPKMISGYLTSRPQLPLVLVLIEAERGPSQLDFSFLQWMSEKKIPCAFVATKVDRLSPAHQIEQRARMASALGITPAEMYWVSAQKGYGMNELRLDVAKALGLIKLSPGEKRESEEQEISC